MFDFFQSVFSKVVSLTASAIIAVGLISVPETPKQPTQPEQPKKEIILEVNEVNKVNKERTQPEKTIIKSLVPKTPKKSESEDYILRQKIDNLNEEIKELENQKTADLERNKEEERKNQQEEQQKQEELIKQQELEKRFAEERDNQIKAEKEQARQENEQKTISQFKSNVIYFTNQVSSLNGDVEQVANEYRLSMDREQTNYLNQTDSYKSIYSPAITKRHREVLNEASKGIWTDCTWLRTLWDYQSADYQQYSTNLNNAERSLKSNIGLTANPYQASLNFYLTKINTLKQQMNEFLSDLNGFSFSDIEIYKNQANAINSDLNSLESKINSTKSYSISISPVSSLLSEVDPLIQEEKNWFAKTSCKNLP